MSPAEIWNLYSSNFEYNGWTGGPVDHLSKVVDRQRRVVPYYIHPSNPGEPSVSKYLIEQGLQPKYPGGKEFAACVSHDVDLLYEDGRKVDLLSSAARLDVKRFKKSFQQNFRRHLDDDLHLKHLEAIDKSYGVKATYYFLSVTREKPEDFNYEIAEVEHLIKWLRESGNEIGLHGSRRAATDITELNKELALLKTVHDDVTGYRNHFLKFETPKSWKNLERAGFLYDTTLGYSHVPGFRNGMCHPYQPYDCNERRWLDIYEIPLIAMDVSFFLRMQLDMEMSFQLFKLLVDSVKQQGGVFTFLWHNNFLTNELGDLYKRCLSYLAQENAWFATGNEVIDHWTANGYFETQKEILSKTLNS